MKIVFLLVITLTITQAIYSFVINNNDQIENKLDEIRQISSSLPLEKQTNMGECLLKNHLSNILNRNRRASISRPYFNYWRPVRDNSRYSTKNSLAFSPRLGKRANEDINELENVVYRSTDFDTFLINLVGYLQDNKIDIVYEDSTKICFSQPISIEFIQQFLDKFHINRRNQNEQMKKEIPERQSTGKHPVLFRYRLG
ncbi:unnamed protein product [Rotaria sp. Silwood1]|nr:unnamed protein product [Rotaria sp. Silwood1]CAF4660070.1 unnamed protein product [Rotaria sp. Silwood1]